jgi:hypothetical protein
VFSALHSDSSVFLVFFGRRLFSWFLTSRGSWVKAVKLLASVLEMLVAVWIVLSVQQFCFG